MTQSISTRAYAKINLGLRILGRRTDGFHEIETILHRIDIYDTVRLEQSGNIELQVSNHSVPSDGRNLCLRAATLMQRELWIDQGVRVLLTKNIPVGAGLGGGSADAAAVLRALPCLWNVPIDESRLRSMAESLGSDVPFFLNSGSAVARGRGERLKYFPLRLPYAILVCYPRFNVSTAWAYDQVREYSVRESRPLKEALLAGLSDSRELERGLTNDFEPIVFKDHPQLRGIKEEMLNSGAVYSSVSGSGSSILGLFTDLERLHESASRLQTRGFDLFITPHSFTPLHEGSDRVEIE